MTNLLQPVNVSKSAIAALIALVLAFDLAFAVQKLDGAYRSEFGGHPSEAAHFVSALFWRDFAVSLARDRSEGKHEAFGAAKAEFSREFGAHYPRVETSGGKSLFTGLEALWMLVFPPVRGSLLMLMAALSGILATQLFVALKQEYGRAGAGLAAALLLVLPLVREFTALAMPDVLTAVFAFGAAMAFGNYLDREKCGDALLTGILGGLAVLTSQSGNEAGFAVAAAFLMSRKFQLLRKPAWWGMAALIAGAAVFRGFPAVRSSQTEAIPFFLGEFWGVMGLALIVLMVVGILVKMGGAGERGGRWLAAGGLLLGTPLWLIMTRASPDARQLLPALPAALMFALAGGSWLVKRFAGPGAGGGKERGLRVALAAVFVVLALASAVLPWSRTVSTGFAPLVEALLEDSSPGDVTLVSSDASGEERFIAELAARESGPAHFVLFGTRSLGNAGKRGVREEPVFADEDAVFAFLTSGKIKYIVVDDGIPDDERREHHYQIKRVIESHLNRFWTMAASQITRGGELQTTSVTLYKIRDSN